MVPVILAGSMNVGGIVELQAQPPLAGGLAVLPRASRVFVLFFLAMLAESNRIPFDIPEAESELVAGVTTEYTGMKFALFYMAEYVHTLVGSAAAAALFLGGWDGPFAPGPALDGAQDACHSSSSSTGCAGRCCASAPTS